jgi:hypothetical protein
VSITSLFTCFAKKQVQLSKRNATYSFGSKRYWLATLTLSACFSGQINAAVKTDWLDDLHFHGFGTLGGVYQDDTGETFRRDFSQGGGAKDGQISLAQDSMLGGQLTAKINALLSVSTQVLSRLSTENNYDPQVSWAFAKYTPEQNMALRLGRLGVESYLQGDSAEIGYANLMIRQPIIFIPRTFNGMDAEITEVLGTGSLRLKAAAGWTKGKVLNLNSVYDTDGSLYFGGSVDYQIYGWTARIALSRMQMHNEFDSMQPGSALNNFLQLAPNGADIHKELTMKNRLIDYRSIALAYDNGPIQAVGSYSTESSADWPDVHLFYANFGYRIHQFIPYISYSFQSSPRNIIASGIPGGAGFDAANQSVALAQAGLRVNQNDLVLGIRYDFLDNMALKFQVDQLQYKDTQNIIDQSFLSLPPADRPSKNLTVYSLALDFVF